MGIANADGRNTQPIGMQGGVPIFERHVAFGFFIIVEAAAGQSGQNPGTLTFNWSPDDPNLLPNLRIVSSRALGNGSPAVCDDGPNPPIGGCRQARRSPAARRNRPTRSTTSPVAEAARNRPTPAPELRRR
jgi:hypothetical protein